MQYVSGPNPGFSVGGAVDPFCGGVWPPTWALFSENVCENERIGSCRGHVLARPPRSAYAYRYIRYTIDQFLLLCSDITEEYLL